MSLTNERGPELPWPKGGAHVKLTHPDSKQTLEVDDDKAGPYLSQGWAEKPAPEKKS